MKVDILENMEDGTRHCIATFRWHEGELSCDNPVLWKHLMNSSGGVIIGARGKRYYPRDGDAYLRNLKYQFAGPYLFAQPPEEDESPPPPQHSSVGGPAPSETSISGATSTGPVSQKHREKTQSGRVGPFSPGDARAREIRKGRSHYKNQDGLHKNQDGRGELSREATERICGGVFRISSALRGLSYEVAHAEADGLLGFLTELVVVETEGLARAFESREEYLELRYQPPSKQNYVKVWERTNRLWQEFLEVLEAGDLETAMWPLFMVREGTRILPEHRSVWTKLAAGEIAGMMAPAGTSAEEVQRGWEKFGAPALRRRSLSAALLDEVYEGVAEPFRSAVTSFQQANLGKCEEELRRALLIDPSYTEARLLLGDLLRRLERAPEALEELRHVVELEHLYQRNRRGQIGYIWSFLRMGRARACIGRTLLGLGRIREAAEQLERGLESLDRMSRKMPAEMQEDAHHAQLEEEMVSIHRLLERLYRDLGDTERADHHHKRSIGH